MATDLMAFIILLAVVTNIVDGNVLGVRNLVCDVDVDAGPVTELDSLRCELWTSGATELIVTGGELPMHEQTLVPLDVPGCDEPAASEIEVVLGEPLDGGT